MILIHKKIIKPEIDDDGVKDEFIKKYYLELQSKILWFFDENNIKDIIVYLYDYDYKWINNEEIELTLKIEFINNNDTK